MKKIVLMLGILGMLTGCIPLDSQYYGSSNYQSEDIHEQIKKAYGVKESKGKARWDINYEDLMY